MNFPILVLILLLDSIYYNVAEDINHDDRALKDLLIDLDVGDGSNDDYYNPNDMLAPPKVPSTVKKKESFLLEDIEKEKESCLYENSKVVKCKGELKKCFSQLNQIEHELTNEKKKVAVLSSKVLDKKDIDMKEFYKRIILRFWSLLNMKTTEMYLRGDSDAIAYNLVVKVTQRDIDAFKEYFEGENTQNQIDSFFSENFYTIEKEEIQLFQQLTGMMNNFYYNLRSFDFWLNLFWLLLIIVGIWGFYLFVKDIQRELNWKKVMIMFLLLAFIISFIHHWRNMIKVQEAKRNRMLASMQKSEFENVTCEEDNSYWFKISSTLFGTRSKCEEYHEKMMIPPNEEISLGVAMMETISSLILIPIKDSGLYLGLFFNNFFTSIPWIFQFQSVIIFVFLFTLIIFAVFGYGIHFPFWLGGIKPRKPRNDSSENLKKLIKENEERVERINSAMIHDAKEMLTKVSEIAIAQAQAQSSSSTLLVEPIVQKCTVIIEKKLEDLINKKIVNVLEYPAPIQDSRRGFQSELIEDEVDKKDCSKDLIGQCVTSCRQVKMTKEVSQRSSQEEENSRSDFVSSEDINRESTSQALTKVSNEMDNDFMNKLKKIFEDQ
ncbi:Chloride channel CLIC-like protein 1 [Armadillidium nasatum]|uniref:Chloride channel CLIC-like protein 1 n=1 Tax=Armadillidium nasatum TaxID=96803 RepID=A0A5N5TES9_9CRUS|nr:Chloride channel CLIC-like protein 1 [Armadillidium nasatum]